MRRVTDTKTQRQTDARDEYTFCVVYDSREKQRVAQKKQYDQELSGVSPEARRQSMAGKI